MLLFFNSYGKIYSSDILSLSSIISLVFLCFLIFVPLFIAYSTENFWQRVKIYQEQPYVKLNEKYFISTIEKDNNNIPSSKFYTSSYEINEKINTISEEYLITDPIISISNFDENGDSFNDKIKIKLSFLAYKLENIKLMFFFDYYLQNKVRFYMESMMFLDLDIPENTNKITMNGELVLNQKSPISQTAIPKVLKNEYLFEVDNESPYDMLELYNRYSKRNVTTKFEGDIFFSNPHQNNNNDDVNIEITININIPKLQDVCYYSSFAETIKEAWSQYIFIFIPFYFLIHFILSFILRNRVFPCSVQSDIEGDVQDIY